MQFRPANAPAATLGRFLQTDPIGYADGMNMYAYVGGDPVNKRDPSGKEECRYEDIIGGGASGEPPLGQQEVCDITVFGKRGDFYEPTPLEPYDFGTSTDEWGPLPTAPVAAPSQKKGSTMLLSQKAQKAEPTKKLETPDYCGSDATGTGTGFVPDTPGGRTIAQACKTHDACYSSSTDRYTCDLGLMVDAYNECRRDSGSNRQCAWIGTIYFLGVRAGVWPSYTGTGRSR